MRIELATGHDFPAFLTLASQVEALFGPMAADPAFYDALRRNVSRGSAIVARDHSGVIGGLFFAHYRRPIYTVGWLVVDESTRSKGVGEALLSWAFRDLVEVPATVDVVTFGADHPGARARAFYQRLGFRPEEMAENGPEGGSRQIFRLDLDELPKWASR